MTDVVKVEVDVELVKAAVHAISTAQQVVLDEGATLAQARRFIKLSSAVAHSLNQLITEHKQKPRDESVDHGSQHD